MCSELDGGRCRVAVFMPHSLGLRELCAIEKEWTGRKGGRERLFILQFRFLGEDVATPRAEQVELPTSKLAPPSKLHSQQTRKSLKQVS